MTRKEVFETIGRNIALIEKKIASCDDDELIIKYLGMIEKFLNLYNGRINEYL